MARKTKKSSFNKRKSGSSGNSGNMSSTGSHKSPRYKRRLSLVSLRDLNLKKATESTVAARLKLADPDRVTMDEVKEFYSLLADDVTIKRLHMMLCIKEFGWSLKEVEGFFTVLLEKLECMENPTDHDEECAEAVVHFLDIVFHHKHTRGEHEDITKSMVLTKTAAPSVPIDIATFSVEGDEMIIPPEILFEVMQSEELGSLLKMRSPKFRALLQKKETEKAEAVTISKTPVKRQNLVSTLREVVDRDDAFITLPWTLVYIVLFMFVLFNHLDIYSRAVMGRVNEDWMNGRDPFTAADENVDNLPSYWEWVVGVAIPGAFGDQVIENNHTKYWLASRHVLVGGFRLECQKLDGTVEIHWLNQMDASKASLEVLPGNYYNATLASAAVLIDDEYCGSKDTEKTWLSYMTYDELASAYTISTAYTWFDRYGQAVPIIDTDVILIDPFPTWFTIFIDILFALLVTRIFLKEAWSLLSTMRLGWSEFLDYWDVWNVVDWLSISCSAWNCGLLAAILLIMTDETLSIIIDENYAMDIDVWSLGEEELELIYDTVAQLGSLFQLLHLVMALNTITVLFKFFKSFQSNPRLKVVTDTFVQASVDLAHFFIIFCTLFLPVVLVGHILFGKDIPEMGSIFASLSTGIYTLLGDYTWFEDLYPRTLTTTLPSGCPAILVFLWFSIFHFVITLVVLNMLLGIILEHYVRITDTLKTMAHAPEIWVQVRDYLKFLKETRGFLSLVHLDLLLNNDGDPAHKDPSVTHESLKQAFDGMQDKQSEWLMNFLRTEVYLIEKANEVANEGRDRSEDILANAGDSSMSAFGLFRDLEEIEPVWMDKLEDLTKVLAWLQKDMKNMYKKLEEMESVEEEDARPSSQSNELAASNSSLLAPPGAAASKASASKSKKQPKSSTGTAASKKGAKSLTPSRTAG